MPLCNSTKLVDFPSASKGEHIVDRQSFIRSLKFTLLEAYKRKHTHYITDKLSDCTSFGAIWLWDVPEVDSAMILLVDSSSWFLERKRRQSLCNYHQTIKILRWNYEDKHFVPSNTWFLGVKSNLRTWTRYLNKNMFPRICKNQQAIWNSANFLS